MLLSVFFSPDLCFSSARQNLLLCPDCLVGKSGLSLLYCTSKPQQCTGDLCLYVWLIFWPISTEKKLTVYSVPLGLVETLLLRCWYMQSSQQDSFYPDWPLLIYLCSAGMRPLERKIKLCILVLRQLTKDFLAEGSHLSTHPRQWGNWEIKGHTSWPYLCSWSISVLAKGDHFAVSDFILSLWGQARSGKKTLFITSLDFPPFGYVLKCWWLKLPFCPRIPEPHS